VLDGKNTDAGTHYGPDRREPSSDCQPAASALAVIALSTIPLYAQVLPVERMQVRPPSARAAAKAGASAEDIEIRADELRAAKAYFDAIDYYRAALAKRPDSAALYNKLGISQLLSQRFREAHEDFEHALKLNRRYVEAYNNLGVVEYMRRKYGPAVKQYNKAIVLSPDVASYYSNLGAAYFS
jgi:tetratricopeptide (TPR) repeat protein